MGAIIKIFGCNPPIKESLTDIQDNEQKEPLKIIKIHI